MPCRIWVDLETTGLELLAGEILEIAVVATEPTAPGYVEVASKTWVVRPYGTRWLDELDPRVREMHTANGLLVDVAERGVSLTDAENALLGFLRYYGNPAPGREPIAGSSPHFDAAWLAVHCPRARAYFNHRTFCASGLKRFAEDLGHTIPPGDPAHRALADVRSAIELARKVARAISGL